MRPQLRFLLLLVIACLGSTARPQNASAQTVSIPPAFGFDVIRKNPRTTDELPLVISTQDCLDDDPSEANYNEDDKTGARTWIELNLALSDPNPRHTLEFWASQTADCTTLEERNGNTARCRQIAPSEQANLLAKEVTLYPRPIVAPDGYAGSPTGDDYPDKTTCNNQQEVALIIWVLLFNGETLIDSARWDLSSIDTLPPPAPSSLTAGPGDQLLFFDWDIPSENEEDDTEGFSFFCTNIEYSSGNAPDPANGGAGGESFASCSLEDFDAGNLEPADFAPCGSVKGRTARDGQSITLQNGDPYAAYVTSTDTVGNKSVGSNYACATPQEVITFFEEYKESGGKGGGGFCSFSARRQTSLWLLLSSALLLLAARRRRSHS